MDGAYNTSGRKVELTAHFVSVSNAHLLEGNIYIGVKGNVLYVCASGIYLKLHRQKWQSFWNTVINLRIL